MHINDGPGFQSVFDPFAAFANKAAILSVRKSIALVDRSPDGVGISHDDVKRFFAPRHSTDDFHMRDRPIRARPRRHASGAPNGPADISPDEEDTNIKR